MNYDFASILAIIIVFQLLFLSLFLFISKKGKGLSNRLLGLFFFLIALSFIDILLTIQGFQYLYHHISQLDLAILLLLGPLFLFYTKSIVYHNYYFKAKDFLHLFPFIVITCILLISYNVNNPQAQKRLLNEINNFKLPIALTLFVYSFYLHILVYLYFSLKEVRKYGNVMKENYSELSKLNLRWLKFMINSLVVLVLIAFFQSVLPYTFGKTYIYFFLIALILFVFYFINHVILKALNYPELFSGIKKSEKEVKYAGSTLTENERERYKTALVNYIDQEKPFLISELNINDLAMSLNISSKKISQVINQSFNQSFFDFINSYRIDEVKKKLKDINESGMTILEIMYDCGFNSKSSFNTCFKKMTGMTPSEYKKSVKTN